MSLPVPENLPDLFSVSFGYAFDYNTLLIGIAVLGIVAFVMFKERFSLAAILPISAVLVYALTLIDPGFMLLGGLWILVVMLVFFASIAKGTR
jgi:hypothetical protein